MLRSRLQCLLTTCFLITVVMKRILPQLRIPAVMQHPCLTLSYYSQSTAHLVQAGLQHQQRVCHGAMEHELGVLLRQHRRCCRCSQCQQLDTDDPHRDRYCKHESQMRLATQVPHTHDSRSVSLKLSSRWMK